MLLMRPAVVCSLAHEILHLIICIIIAHIARNRHSK